MKHFYIIIIAIITIISTYTTTAQASANKEVTSLLNQWTDAYKRCRGGLEINSIRTACNNVNILKDRLNALGYCRYYNGVEGDYWYNCKTKSTLPSASIHHEPNWQPMIYEIAVCQFMETRPETMYGQCYEPFGSFASKAECEAKRREIRNPYIYCLSHRPDWTIEDQIP